MSTPVNNQTGAHVIDAFVRALTTANALIPAAAPGVAIVVDIFKSGMQSGKTPEQMEAEAADSRATALRTREKSETQMGDQG